MANDWIVNPSPKPEGSNHHSNHRGWGPVAEARAQRPAPLYLGHSPAARAVRNNIQNALVANSSVLIVGPPGVDKRRIADILHHFSGAEVPRLEILNPDELEARDTLGDFVYLERLEELSLAQQVQLRERIGLTRVIFGTELDPASDEGHARLHASLLRWCPVRVDLPELKQRTEDIEALVHELLLRLPSPRPIGAISDEALACLRAYHWPDNDAELELAIREALASCRSAHIELRDLPARLRIRDAGELDDHDAEDLSLAAAERRAVARAMRHARGNKRLAARLLQIGKTTLYRKLDRYNSPR